VNINDDDILQDPAYAAAIFALIGKYGFRIHGIQTSPASLLESDGRPKASVLDLVADPGLYSDHRPLLWLGSDVFLPQRAKRLGKRLPAPEAFASLLVELERRGLRHFHYWISSDGDSSWEEFCAELAMIVSHHKNFPGFGLLAHAPFIVPYPASRLFQQLAKSDGAAVAMKVRGEWRAPDPLFSLVFPERLETAFPNLNRLLRNEKAGGENGFFDLLKEKDFMAAAQLAYHFLKQEILQNATTDPNLLKAREIVEKLIVELIELRNR